MSKILEVASHILDKVKNLGATSADVFANESSTLSVHSRMKKIESMEQAGTTGLGLRVFIGAQQAMVATNDLSPNSIDALCEKAIELAKVLPPDQWAGLAPQELIDAQKIHFDQNLYYDETLPSIDELGDRATLMEEAAFHDPRIHNSEGANVSCSHNTITLVTSTGFQGTYKKSYYNQSICVLARADDGKMEQDYDFDTRSFYRDLSSAQTLGAKVADMVLKRLNSQKIDSQKLTVIFDPRVASSLLGHFVEAINGHNVTKSSTFLKNRLNDMVFNPNITIVDDPFLKGGVGFKPFDGEGLATYMQTLVDQGNLMTWLLDMRSARQLGLNPTAHAGRSVGSAPFPTTSNVYIQNGKTSPQDMIKNTQKGLYVTDLMGSGVNLINGDYSRGASGFLIENGVIGQPVSEVTIAGNLNEIFKEMIPANDLAFKKSMSCPTLMIPQMTLAGQ